jgi:predicted peptidase
MSPVTRRSLLIGGATVAAVALQPGIAQATTDDKTAAVRFTLNATTLDGGEQVTSLTLDASCFDDIVASSLTAATFAVHAKAESPFTLPAGSTNFGVYDVDRIVTAVRLVHGKIVIDLKSGFTNSTNPNGTIATNGAPGAGTLGYVIPAGRNVRSKLTYTITQMAPIALRKGGSMTLPAFTQGKMVNPAVDVYKYAKSADGMNYRLYVPEGRSHDKKPLIVWLHGGGEGGSAALSYYDNEATLRANRGALGFSTGEAQRIFGGAYVVAPQAEDAWMADGPGYAPRLKALIDDLVKRYGIDPKRIHVVGCSNGGYMSLYMSFKYPSSFASEVPICPGASDRFFTEAQLASIPTPTWLVQSKADTTLPPAVNSIRANNLIKGSLLSLYDTVTWDGVTYNGHWSWIYVANNDPMINGKHVWQWMAKQHLNNGH